MSLSVSPSETTCFECLVQLNAALFGADFPTERTQLNRVPESSAPNFCMVTPLARPRLSTNVDTYEDCQFVASISGTTMTVTAVVFGTLIAGRTVFGVDVAAGTTIISGPSNGGTGVYTVSTSQTVTSRTMACGIENLMQPIELTMQLDFYGPESAGNATVFSTMFRDEYATTFFRGLTGVLSGAVSPLYTSDPRQMYFITEEQQYQGRWMVTAAMQVNSTVSVPMQFAGAAEVDTIDVGAIYPLT